MRVLPVTTMGRRLASDLKMAWACPTEEGKMRMGAVTRALALCLVVAGCGAVREYRVADGRLPPARAVSAQGDRRGEPETSAGGAVGEFDLGLPRSRANGIVEGPLTLSGAVDVALRQNLAVLMARRERETADGMIQEAWAAGLPNVSLDAAYARLHETPALDLDAMGMGSGTMEMGKQDNFSAALKLVQPLYLGGQVFAARRGSVLFKESVEAQIAEAEEGIVLLAHKGFYDVLLAKEDLAAAREALDIARRHERDVRRRREVGLATEFEVIRASTRSELTKTQLIQATNALSLARTSLFTMLRLPPDSEMEIAGELSCEPREVDRDQALDAALARRPELARQRLFLEMQREQIVVTKAGRKPQVFLFGELGYEDPTTRSMGSLDDDTYWEAGLSVKVPVFEGGRTSGRLAQDHAKLAQIEMSVAQLSDRIRLEVTQAVLKLREASELVSSQEKVLAQAREGLRLAQAGYEQGLNRQLDVLDAQHGLTQARRGHARAAYAHLMAEASLRKATGTLTSAPREEETR